MANLSPGGDGERSRGQLLLVGAFGLAVLLLVLAGVLNTVTYTESLATRGDGVAGGRDVAAFQEDVARDTAGIVARVNDDDTTLATKRTHLEGNLSAWGETIDRHYARDVVATDLSVVSTTEGSRIAQSSVGPLTDGNGTANWTLAENVSQLRRFVFALDQSSLGTAPCSSGDCYELVLENGTSRWRLAVNRSMVVVDTPDGGGTCPIEAGRETVWIDVTDGTVDGQACEPLQFGQGVPSPYDVRYQNGDAANGTYSVVVGSEANVVEDINGSSPSVSPAVYATYVRVTYHSPELVYSNVIRVAGGEPDA